MKQIRKWVQLLVVMAVVMMMGVNAQAAAKINKTSAILIKGQKLTLKIKGTKKKVKWTSSKPKIAAVSSKGTVKAKAKGSTVIKAKVGKKTFKCKIKVETPKLNKTSGVFTAGYKYKLKVKGTTQKVTWKSSDKTIVVVSKSGVIRGKKAGEATVTAKIGKKAYKCAITIEQPSISNESLSLFKGNTWELEMNGTVRDAIWWSEDESIATVDEGLVTAVGVGSTRIIAQVGNTYTYPCTVNVSNPVQAVSLMVTAVGVGSTRIIAQVGNTYTYPCTVNVSNPVQAVSLDRTDITLTEGETYTLSASYSPADAQGDKTVHWSSSDETVAKVGSSGKVTARKAGTARITAQIGSKAASCIVRVVKYEPNMKDYYARVISYLQTKGKTNGSGAHFIEASETISGRTVTYAVLYAGTAHQLSLTMTSTSDSAKTGLTMMVNVLESAYVDPAFTIVYTSSNSGFQSKARIEASSYTGEDNVEFELVKAQKMTPSDSFIQSTSNSELKKAFTGWAALLSGRIGVPIQNLGFYAYSGAVA